MEAVLHDMSRKGLLLTCDSSKPNLFTSKIIYPRKEQLSFPRHTVVGQSATEAYTSTGESPTRVPPDGRQTRCRLPTLQRTWVFYQPTNRDLIDYNGS
jgi:hypothetical protein